MRIGAEVYECVQVSARIEEREELGAWWARNEGKRGI